MESSLNIDVAILDTPHRLALEEVIDRELVTSERFIISVIDAPLPEPAALRPAQTLEDWTRIYDGLSEQQVEDIDAIAKTRANLTRKFS